MSVNTCIKMLKKKEKKQHFFSKLASERVNKDFTGQRYVWFKKVSRLLLQNRGLKLKSPLICSILVKNLMHNSEYLSY